MRVSVVDFVNSWPLAWGFLEGRVADASVERDLPATCARRLAAGEVDAGLVPAAALGELPQYEPIRGLGIAARREARSVLLLARRPWSAIASIALDPASRSSSALVRLLFEGRAVDWRSSAGAVDPAAIDVDALLVIGDPALRLDPELRRRVDVIDLAEEWNRRTGLPFVFAVWAKRSGLPGEPFFAARAAGRTELSAIVARASAATGLAPELLDDYLGRQLRYDLDEADEAGLAEFLGRAEAAQIIPPVRWTTFSRR